MSLRNRLLLALVAAVLAALAIVDVLTYTLVTRAQVDQVDEELERAHSPIEDAADGSSPDGERTIRDVAPGFYVELRAPSGDSIVSVPLSRPGEDTISLAGVALPAPTGERGDDQAVFTTVRPDGDHRIRVRVSLQSDGNVLVIGRSMESIEHTNERLLKVLVIATGGALGAVVVMGWWLVRIGLRPLVAVERAAGGITDAELDRRVPGGDANTEMGRLADAINRMLDRLHGAFEQRARDLVALQQSEARMRQFVADASHELRTPIAATAAYAELFERGARDRPDDLARAMAGIRTETSRMADLVEDLLLLAQLDEGRPLARLPVDIADVAVEAVDSANAVAPERIVELRIDDVVVVDGDSGRLRQVIDNLLANVRTHTPQGTTCRVVVGRDRDDAVITVTDDGPGMSAADAERAFDRFHRADPSRTRSSGGAGLGLAIVAAIVEAHDGEAVVTSNDGSGTSVVIRLPVEQRPT